MESYVRMFDAHARPEGDNPTIRTGGTAGTRATESGRTDGGKSESLIVPLKPGNRPVGPGRGKGAPSAGHARMAQMAEPAVAEDGNDLGAVQPPPRHLSSATPSDLPWRRSRVAKLCHEEPDAGNPHVRICGGPGRVTGGVYPILPHGKIRASRTIHTPRNRDLPTVPPALPCVGQRAPTLGRPLPSLRPVAPTARASSPRQGKAAPTLIPVVPSAIPVAPSRGTAAPRRGIPAPSLAAATPKRGTARGIRGQSPPSDGIE